MRQFLLFCLALLMVIGAVLLQACTPYDTPEPETSAELKLRASGIEQLAIEKARNNFMLPETQAWFSKSFTKTKQPVSADWSQSKLINQQVITPLIKKSIFSVREDIQSYQYLVTPAYSETTNKQQIIELLPDEIIFNNTSFEVVSSFVQILGTGQAPTYLNSFTGGIKIYHSTNSTNDLKNIRESKSLVPETTDISLEDSDPIRKPNLLMECATTTSYVYNENHTLIGVYSSTSCSSLNTGIEGGGGGGGTNPNPVPDPMPPTTGGGPSGGGYAAAHRVRSIESKLPPCADRVLSDLKILATSTGLQGGLLGAILTSAHDQDARIKISFEASANLASNVAGDCRLDNISSSGLNSFTIRINQQYLDGPSTDMMISQIILHEVLHAAIIDYGLHRGLSTNATSFDDALYYWMYLHNIKPNNEQGQHDVMSLFVDQLGQAMYNYYLSVDHSSSLGSQYWQLTSLEDCKDLSWTGLETSIGYQFQAKQDPNFKNRCDVIQGAERNNSFAGRTNSNGTSIGRLPAGQDPCK